MSHIDEMSFDVAHLLHQSRELLIALTVQLCLVLKLLNEILLCCLHLFYERRVGIVNTVFGADVGRTIKHAFDYFNFAVLLLLSDHNFVVNFPFCPLFQLLLTLADVVVHRVAHVLLQLLVDIFNVVFNRFLKSCHNFFLVSLHFLHGFAMLPLSIQDFILGLCVIKVALLC